MEKKVRNPMLAMLVVATALSRISFVHTRTFNEGDFYSLLAQRLYSEDDMTPDFTEQLGRHDHEGDIKKRNHTPVEKYDILQKKTEENTTTGIPLKVPVGSTVDETTKKYSGHNEETMDVVDREDHVSQYLSDLLVNTDSEITSIQGSDADEDREIFEVKEDTFFSFLTGQEKVLEVEGAWSRPINDDLNNEEYLSNVIVDEE